MVRSEPTFHLTMSERVRLTISVTPEVHAAFTRLSAASGMSLGRAMGEWLEDTLEAASYTADMVEKARAAPKQVMREVHAYALGLADETGAVLQRVRASKTPAANARSAFRSGGADASAPSSNTGLKSPPPSTRRGSK
jgi:hypothetical protein